MDEGKIFTTEKIVAIPKVWSAKPLLFFARVDGLMNLNLKNWAAKVCVSLSVFCICICLLVTQHSYMYEYTINASSLHQASTTQSFVMMLRFAKIKKIFLNYLL